jgi:hypothetical protein
MQTPYSIKDVYGYCAFIWGRKGSGGSSIFFLNIARQCMQIPNFRFKPTNRHLAQVPHNITASICIGHAHLYLRSRSIISTNVKPRHTEVIHIWLLFTFLLRLIHRLFHRNYYMDKETFPADAVRWPLDDWPMDK